jgi:nucleoid-associated protein YgaU
VGRAIGRVLAPFGALALLVLVVFLLGTSDVLAGRERARSVSPAASTSTTVIDLVAPPGVPTTISPQVTTPTDPGAGGDSNGTTADTSGSPDTTSSAGESAGGASGAGEPTLYTVKPGDSPYSIAREFGVSTARLIEVNGIDDPRSLRPGVVLTIPAE